jgi:drug/metabolite transporter (DMT)-like permease
MTPLIALLALLAEICLVIGQLLIKRAMILTNTPPTPKPRFTLIFSLGIATLSLYFFLWIGLMQNKNLLLSQQYAFDALAPVLLVLATTLFLKEKISKRAFAGIALISLGLLLIALP